MDACFVVVDNEQLSNMASVSGRSGQQHMCSVLIECMFRSLVWESGADLMFDTIVKTGVKRRNTCNCTGSRCENVA